MTQTTQSAGEVVTELWCVNDLAARSGASHD